MNNAILNFNNVSNLLDTCNVFLVFITVSLYILRMTKTSRSSYLLMLPDYVLNENLWFIQRQNKRKSGQIAVVQRSSQNNSPACT